MDIVTHAGIGLAAASPFLADRPELALGIVAGSVLPDLDALCRLVNKTAFLRAHQTWSHALPVELAFSIAAAAVALVLGLRGAELGIGLLAGFIGHSLLDLTNALAVFGVTVAILHWLGSSLSWIVAIVTGHFFLFCNIFRVARRRELIWAAFFVLNVAFWLLLGRMDWSNMLACQLPVSAGVIAWELKAASYHGIFADRLNAHLADYVDGPANLTYD